MTESAGPRPAAGSSPERGDGPASFVDEREPQVRILVGLSRIGEALRSRAWEDASPRGLNPTQARILTVLSRADRNGIGLSVLAEQLGVSPPTVSDSVSALEKKGLVAKGAGPDDGRRLSITLTRKGRDAARDVARWPEDLVASIDQLSDDDQAAFLRSLVEVVRAMVARGQIAPTRTCATCRFFVPDAHDDSDRPHHCQFVDAAFGDLNLRLDCLDHERADADGT